MKVSWFLSLNLCFSEFASIKVRSQVSQLSYMSNTSYSASFPCISCTVSTEINPIPHLNAHANDNKDHRQLISFHTFPEGIHKKTVEYDTLDIYKHGEVCTNSQSTYFSCKREYNVLVVIAAPMFPTTMVNTDLKILPFSNFILFFIGM